MATIKHFRDLRAWQQCRVVRQRVRLMVKEWPSEEKFRLTDQIIRSSRGPTSHIAEGYGRFHEKDNIRFCRIARGSLYETQDHLITACDEGLIEEAAMTEHVDLIEGTIKTVNAYINYLNSIVGGNTNMVSEPVAIYGNDQAGPQDPPSPENPLETDL
jgi:four helix bundle protein